ncbi:MAG: FtsX-like permease family protein [Acidobacteria bacterium]|nr:FtsX-like permease family protein [Acidobacteriota bacterium]
MKLLPLVWKNLGRRKVRTTFTLLSILVAFVLFGYLSAITTAFGMGVELTGNDRLVLIHKVSLIQLLPESYQARLEAIPGVIDVCHQTWFGGIYQDPKNFFMQMPVEPERFLRLFPEFKLPEDQKKAWLADRRGAVVGRATAERFGWKIGDRIPIQGTIWRQKDGSATWEFNLVGIYDGAKKGTDTTQFFFRYDYFNEARQFGEGAVGWYTIKINDPARAAQIAERIDATFANSPYETKTTTEKAFAQAFAKQVGDIGAIMQLILGAVFFTILLVAANTMAQSVRERTSELAVLKTLGFSNALVLTLVLVESLIIASVGGLLGLGLAWLMILRGDPTGGALPAFYLPVRSLALGVLFVFGLGLVAGIFPAVQAMRLRIVDALRRS